MLLGKVIFILLWNRGNEVERISRRISEGTNPQDSLGRPTIVLEMQVSEVDDHFHNMKITISLEHGESKFSPMPIKFGQASRSSGVCLPQLRNGRSSPRFPQACCPQSCPACRGIVCEDSGPYCQNACLLKARSRPRCNWVCAKKLRMYSVLILLRPVSIKCTCCLDTFMASATSCRDAWLWMRRHFRAFDSEVSITILFRLLIKIPPIGLR